MSRGGRMNRFMQDDLDQQQGREVSLYDTIQQDIRVFFYNIQQNHELVWVILAVTLLLVYYRNTIKRAFQNLFTKKEQEYAKEKLEEFDENVRLARLKLQEQQNEVSQEKKEQQIKKEQDKILNPPKKTPRDNERFSAALNQGSQGGGGSYRPSLSMRKQGSSCCNK
ncbi:hypothetical protein DFA_08791 [Cavenderia fasciculata]|uniref:Selenoprotein S n=1 Tax=Cavenderia fasciculata TaxID=261658 RepID=F4Q489_CACFS|nr:uncharacterized protein DFA_08791 [Cavenderia fasciculata]EGG17791.1 hypothetical protein DFA_08791 [Cavenderia fasciculata]|eukprot:XP_004356275.1 hypothetical protein DFA_08791 [Cavenderia fasciculata]